MLCSGECLLMHPDEARLPMHIAMLAALAGNSRWSAVQRGRPAGLSVRWARRHGNVAAQVQPMRITS